MKEVYPMAEISEDEQQWGVHPNCSDNLLRFILSNDVDIWFDFVKLSTIPGNAISEFMQDNINLDNDIIVGYDYQTVFGVGKSVGHVSLVSSLNNIGNTVVLIDPEDVHPVEVNTNKLIAGVQKMAAGFWIFSSPEKQICIEYI